MTSYEYSSILALIILRGKLSFFIAPMKTDKRNEWLKCKHYMHLDLPIEGARKSFVASYVQNPKAIVKHAFLPLIRRTICTYPYRMKGGVRKSRVKKRILTYASHEDSVIFSYYAYNLQAKYEAYLENNSLGDVVTAYRKICCQTHEGNKSSIDFAFDVFQCIKQRLMQEHAVSVITFDIKSFFDNLDHRLLKRNWERILEVEKLPADVYAIYKHVVNYSYVDDFAVFKLFENSIVCEGNKTSKVSRKVKNKAFLRDKKALAYCLKQNIGIVRKNGLIRTHKKEKNAFKGIPQGLPISSVLANLYLMDFDLEVKNKLAECDAIYRRYSDDIIVICPINKGNEIKAWIREKIKDVHLEIQESKTNLYTFTSMGKTIRCEHSEKGTNKKLEYLGFSFDGTTILLKSSSVGKFYYKMHRSIGRAIHYACAVRNSTRGTIFEHRLISKYTYAGSFPHQIYKRSKSGKFFYTNKGMKTYGNYLSYVRKASEIMGEPKIASQLRKCSNKLNKLIKSAKSSVEIVLSGKAMCDLVKYGRTY